MLPRKINSVISESWKLTLKKSYLCQHDNKEAIFRNLVISHGCVIFENLALMNEKLLRTGKSIFALGFLNLLLDSCDLQTNIDCIHVQSKHDTFAQSKSFPRLTNSIISMICYFNMTIITTTLIEAQQNLNHHILMTTGSHIMYPP